MKKNTITLSLLAVLLASGLGGCGGNDKADSGSSSSVLAWSGFVEDGPVRDAIVALRDTETDTVLSLCGPLGNTRCETRSAYDGSFILEAQGATLPEKMMAVAIGGRDAMTGVDFANLEMRAPLGLFAGREGETIISPVTTLIAGLAMEGQSLATAQEWVRTWLALPPATNLTARPSTDPELLRRTLLLTKVVLELKNAQIDPQPFRYLARRLSLPGLPAEDSLLNPATLSALGLGDVANQRILALRDRLATVPTVQELSAIFTQEEIVQSLNTVLGSMLLDTANFDPANPSYLANVRTLADTLIHAAGSEGIPLGGMSPQRIDLIARYSLYTYNLRTFDAFTLEPAAFAALLVRTNVGTTEEIYLESDPLIAKIAGCRTQYNVAVPLLGDEFLSSNAKRLAYYFGSDVSHLYQAEKLVSLVQDDTINDAIMVKVVEGKALAGLMDEARATITVKIMQSEEKANAYRALGNALISFNRMAEARAELIRAWELYRVVIEAKGRASASNTDTFNLSATSASLRKAGALDDARLVLDYLAEIAAVLVDPTSYLRLVVGTSTVADAYIAASDWPAAAEMVDILYSYAQQTPGSLSGSDLIYKARVYTLIETAKRYADLGNRGRVLQIHDQVLLLTMSGGVPTPTGAASWVYIPDLVATLYQVGETAKALALANSIPASKPVQQASAIKHVATYEALNGSLEDALALVETYFTKPEEKIDSLTYFASNKTTPYIALALINAGPDYFDRAQSALSKAEGLLAGMNSTTTPYFTTEANKYTYLIQRGYVKVADLYALSGNYGKAIELLQQAETIVNNFNGAKERVNGLVDIALGYQQVGQTVTALMLLDQAVSKADTSAASLLPADAALLYEAVVKGSLQLEDDARARQTASAFRRWALAIHTPETVYAGTDNDVYAGKEVDYLLRAALYLVSAGDRDTALAVLGEAKTTADLIQVPATRLSKYVDPKNKHIIGGYANARAYEQALDLALGLEFTANRNQAIGYLADIYIQQDDFPDTWVAGIDSDDDGHPDFFNPLASSSEIAASGLTLDEDSDGDGTPDTVDSRPLYPD